MNIKCTKYFLLHSYFALYTDHYKSPQFSYDAFFSLRKSKSQNKSSMQSSLGCERVFCCGLRLQCLQRCLTSLGFFRVASRCLCDLC